MLRFTISNNELASFLCSILQYLTINLFHFMLHFTIFNNKFASFYAPFYNI
jgi:hypothetical protein